LDFEKHSVTDTTPANRCFPLAEILVIFALFTLQGAWPTPDVNEPHYLGKAAHFWNPDWVRGDFFLDSADPHKVFYFAFGWLTLWLPLPVVAWTGRLLTWLLLAWSWRKLSIAILSPGGATAGLSSSANSTALLDKPAVAPGWSILTAALFIMLNERLSMAGEWFIGGVEAKGFAYVLMLLGLEAMVRNRWNRAWLLFGASAGLHAVVGGWCVAAAGLAWVFMGKNRPTLVSMLLALFGGFLLSLLGVIPALALNRGIDAETIRQANVIYVFERLRHHLDIFQFKIEFLYRFAAMTFGYLFLAWRVNKITQIWEGEAPAEPLETSITSASPTSRQEPRPPNIPQTVLGQTSILGVAPLRILQGFVAGTILIAMIGIAIDLTSFYDRTFAAGLLRFYWFRMADLFVPLGTAFLLAAWIQQRFCLKNTCGAGVSPAQAAGTAAPQIRGVSCKEKRLQAKSRWAKISAIFVLGIAVIAAGAHFGSYVPERINPSPSRADRLEHFAAWRDACRYVSENTPADARFFTPRLSQTFKWHSRRAEVATWKDVPQNAAALVEWRERIQELFTTGNPEPQFRWRENVTEMEPAQLKKLAEKYRAKYIIAPAGKTPPGWKEIYRNEGYSVYRMNELP
jgi:hypothetical protein